MKSYVILDIETRIDKTLVNATQFAGLELSDEDAYHRYRLQLQAEHGSDFLPVRFHVPVSIAVGYVDTSYRLHAIETLSEYESPKEIEAHMVFRFWELVRQGPTLVTYNGRSFDLPVLELAALRYGIPAPAYWVAGTRGPRYRYSEDYHYDVADVLCNSGAVPRMPLSDLLMLIGLPGKGEVNGSKVQQMWESQQYESIHAYCRGDVVRTYALWLRLELIRGRLEYPAYLELEQSVPWLKELR